MISYCVAQASFIYILFLLFAAQLKGLGGVPAYGRGLEIDGF